MVIGLLVIAGGLFVATVDTQSGLMIAGPGLIPLIGGALKLRATANEPKTPRSTFQPTAIHALLLVALLEVAVNRVAVPMLRPFSGTPPWWHTGLDYVGLFLFYFAGALAALVILTRCYSALVARRGLRDTVAHALLAVAALGAGGTLVIAAPAWMSLPLEIAFAAALLALLSTVYSKGADLGVQIGLPIIAIPLLLHTVSVLGAEFVWPESTFDGPGQDMTRAGVTSLCFAALLTPYCFAPRPFARAVVRPVPVVVAMTIAAFGALLARMAYPSAAKATSLAIGVEMQQVHPDQRLALYLLGIATLAWTVTSCAIASSQARRTIGAGMALILLGGYGFKWPHHYLLPLLGFALIADAARRVRDEELAALPISSVAPPIADNTWSTYIGTIAQGLRRTLGDVHTLTTRGDAGLASSVIVGEASVGDDRAPKVVEARLAVRTRIERIDQRVLAMDIVVGREIDELRGAALTLWAIPMRGTGVNPAGPPASPLFKSGDPQFDERFKIRGSALALGKLLDEGLRARAVATLDGWLALWEGEGLRYRVYPGRGAPLDHPMPLSDLALNKVPPSADRLVAVIELLVEIGKRVLEPGPPGEPGELGKSDSTGDVS